MAGIASSCKKKIFVVSLRGQRRPGSQVIPILWLNIFFTTLNLNWDEEEIFDKYHIHDKRVYDEVAAINFIFWSTFVYLIQYECVSYFFLFNCPSQSDNKKRQFPSPLTTNSLLKIGYEMMWKNGYCIKARSNEVCKIVAMRYVRGNGALVF